MLPQIPLSILTQLANASTSDSACMLTLPPHKFICYYYYFSTLGRYDSEGILKIKDNTKLDTNNQPVQVKSSQNCREVIWH